MIDGKTIDAIYLNSYQACLTHMNLDYLIKIAILFRVENVEELKKSEIQHAIANSYVGHALMLAYYNAYSPEDVRMLIENSQCYMILDTLGYDIYQINPEDVAEFLFKDLQMRKKSENPENLKEFSSKRRKKNPWTDRDESFLKKNYLKMDNVELAYHLGRSENSIASKLCYMGITRDVRAKWTRWTKKELEFLEKNHNKLTFEEIAEKLDRSYYSVSTKASRHKLQIAQCD